MSSLFQTVSCRITVSEDAQKLGGRAKPAAGLDATLSTACSEAAQDQKRLFSWYSYSRRALVPVCLVRRQEKQAHP